MTDAPPPPGEPRRGVLLAASIGTLGLLLGLALPFLRGEVYAFDDLGGYHLPFRFFYARSLERGESFDWIPDLFCGFYLLGEGQAGTYHPLHLLLYRFLPLGAAFDLEVLLSYPFACLGTYLFLRRWGLDRAASLFGGFAFAFSGFNLLHVSHVNGVAAAAHLPWLLLGVDVALRSRDRRSSRLATAGVGALTASQILLGYPQYVWLSSLAEAAYAVFLLARPGTIGRRAPSLLAAKALGALGGAVQLLPTFEAFAASPRSALPPEWAGGFSLHPANLVQMIAPYALAQRVFGGSTHEYGLYAGAVPLALGVWWIAARRRAPGEGRALANASLVLAGLALLLAFGRYGPFLPLQKLLPYVGRLRAPCRAVVLFHFALAVLGAVAFSSWIGARREGAADRPRLPVPFLLLPATSLLLAAAALTLRAKGLAPLGEPLGPPGRILAGPLLVGGAATLVAFGLRGRPWAAPGLLLLAAADLGSYGLSFGVYARTEKLDAFVAAQPLPPGPPVDRILVARNSALMAGWRQAAGYVALPASRRLSRPDVPALRVAGVRWVRRVPVDPAPLIPGLLPFDREWSVVPDPLPRARLVARAIPSDDPTRDLPGIPLETAALVESPLDLPEGDPGTARIFDDRPGTIGLSVDAPARRLLVVSESHHPGWEARVDGREAPVLRVNGDYLGCVVEAGLHEVRLDFRPVSRRVGGILSAIGAAALLGWVLSPLLSASRNARAT